MDTKTRCLDGICPHSQAVIEKSLITSSFPGQMMLGLRAPAYQRLFPLPHR